MQTQGYQQERVSVGIAEIHEACKRPESLNLFAGILMGPLLRYPFPESHQAYWALLVNAVLFGTDTELRYALGLPRGFAKTTMMKIFMVWLIIYSPHKFFVVVSATSSKAKAFIADVTGFLSAPNVLQIWGNWETKVTKDTQEEKIFYFCDKNIILSALGAESSVRGLNIDNERPSVIICEDAQEKESAASKELNDKFIEWFVGTLVKARNYNFSLIIYIGNMYNEQCLLNQLRLNDEWVSLITAALLQNGQSIWPDFRTRESLLREYRSDVSLGKGQIFLAEVMNDPNAYKMAWIDLTKIREFPYNLDEPPTCKFLVIDPALGKESSDNTAIGVHGLYDGRDTLMKVESGKWDDTATVENGLRIAIEEGAVLIAVESVAYQATLCNYFSRVMNQRRIHGIAIVAIGPKGISKNKRIENWLKKLISGDCLIHPEAKMVIMHQAAVFNPAKKDNADDELDVGAYGDLVLQEHWDELFYNHGDVIDGEFESAKVLPESQSNCC